MTLILEWHQEADTPVDSCALSERSMTLVTFTSYEAPQTDQELLNQATILQACRATSAASSFFDPLTMTAGGLGSSYEDSFIDGALGYPLSG